MKCFSSIKTVAALFFSLIACDSNAMFKPILPYKHDAEILKSEIIKQQMEPVKKQADAGKAEDQYYYAKYLADHNSPDEAARYFKLAADQDHAKAQFNYGICLTNGSGVEKNLDEAAKYLKLAADQGYAKSQLAYATRLLSDPETKAQYYGTAAAYIQFAADQGYAKAQFLFGVLALNGHGTPKNLQAVKHYWTLAAEQGHVDADLMLNYMFRRRK